LQIDAFELQVRGGIPLGRAPAVEGRTRACHL